MGKAKTRRLIASSKARQHPYQNTSKPGAKPGAKASSKTPQSKTAPPKSHIQPSQNAPIVPFDPYARTLLLGEGDLSFARSLVEHHGLASLTATTFDSREELLEKYPQAQENIEYLESQEQHILHNVDATKLTQKEIRKTSTWDKIVFNFPHVGGKTKDVNRQVRYNQSLLVDTFKASLPLLSPEGSVIVTLFEGEPYTLWNVRDLARHVGLKVESSFKFPWESYPGYKHARTLGNIEGAGAWKGEERKARSYIFVVKEEEKKGKVGRRKGEGMGKKTGKGNQESDSEEG